MDTLWTWLTANCPNQTIAREFWGGLHEHWPQINLLTVVKLVSVPRGWGSIELSHNPYPEESWIGGDPRIITTMRSTRHTFRTVGLRFLRPLPDGKAELFEGRMRCDYDVVRDMLLVAVEV
jgi:hypothetical protein